MGAIGYVRQSRRADLDVALSPEQQRADIETLAARDAVTLSAIFEDLGKSGGHGKERKRTGYQDMLAAIEAGGVCAVYTKTLTRLGRSVTELYRVLRVAEAKGTRIVTMKEGTMDPATPIGKAQFGMMAVFAEFERDLAVERAKDNVATRRARGERMGRVPYGERPGDNLAAVLAAWEATHGLQATARSLNGAGVPSWSGRPWSAPAVRKVLARLAPGAVPVSAASRGVKPVSPFPLFRVLRCHCGRFLTASRVNGGEAVYRCHAAPMLPDHGPSRLRESAILPAIMAEAARFRVPGDVVEQDAANDAERGKLAAKRDRIIDLAADGVIDKPERDRRLAVVDEQLAAIVDVPTLVDIPQAIDWTWPPEKVNAVLRALWDHVELGADMAPVSFAWRVPEWRAAD